MTNPVKGEVTFEARGQTYTFKLGTNAQIMIEAKCGTTMTQFIKDKFNDLGASEVRLIFWAGLYRQHKMTEEDVGDLIDEIGATRVAAIFLEAVEYAAAINNTSGNGDDQRPTKAKAARIGMNS